MNLKEFYQDERSAELKETLRLIRKQLEVDIRERRRLIEENKQLKNLLAWLCERTDVHGNIRRKR